MSHNKRKRDSENDHLPDNSQICILKDAVVAGVNAFFLSLMHGVEDLSSDKGMFFLICVHDFF